MNLAHGQALLDLAAKPTLQRIREDSRDSPPRIRQMLSYLEPHLFETDLDVAQLTRACGIRDRSISTEFRRAVGSTPKEYLQECRLETATRLLSNTDLKISEISDLVGYSTPAVFSRAVERWSGARPQSLRDDARASGQPTGYSSTVLLSSKTWRRAILGQLDSEEAQQFRNHYEGLYPEAFRSTTSDRGVNQQAVRLRIDGESFEDFMAEQIWQQLQALPPDRQRHCVREQLAFRTPALFERLLQESREAGRADRSNGVQIAELAVLSVERPENPAALRAKGWAYLGNARRLATDFLGAEQALDKAEIECAYSKGEVALFYRAEVLDFRAAVRFDQHRYAEALELVDQALAVLEKSAEQYRYFEARIRRANVLCFAGDSAAATSEATEVLEQLGLNRHPHLELSAYSLLAMASALDGKPEQALAALATAGKLAATSSDSLVPFHLQWLKGLVQSGQGHSALGAEYLSAAKNGFQLLGAKGLSATVALDLAVLLCSQDRFQQVVPLLIEALPVLREFDLKQEAEVSLCLLEDAVKAGCPDIQLLLKARSALSTVLRLPPLNSEARLAHR